MRRLLHVGLYGVVGVALVAPVAHAAVTILGWGSSPTVAAVTYTSIQGGQFRYLVIPAATDDVAAAAFPLDLRCEGPVNVLLDGDIAATTVGATVGLWDCQRIAGAPTTLGYCIPVQFDSDGNGIPDTNILSGDTATGNDHLYGVFAQTLAVTVTNSTNKDAWLRVSCPWMRQP